jgi:hypothetical protein
LYGKTSRFQSPNASIILILIALHNERRFVVIYVSKAGAGWHSSTHSKLTWDDIRLKSFNQVLLCQFFTLVVYRLPTNLLWRDEDIRRDMDDTILGHTVRKGDFGESIDLDFDETSPASYIDAEVFVVEKGWEINLWNDISHDRPKWAFVHTWKTPFGIVSVTLSAL